MKTFWLSVSHTPEALNTGQGCSLRYQNLEFSAIIISSLKDIGNWLTSDCKPTSKSLDVILKATVISFTFKVLICIGFRNLD